MEPVENKFTKMKTDEYRITINSLISIITEFIMKKQILTIAMTVFVMSFLLVGQSDAQDVPQPKTELAKQNMGGPRLGVTYVIGNTELSKALKTRGIDPVLSQFGWHFEYQVKPKTGGPAFLVEFIPLVAGVEYGTLIPSANLMLGIRFPNGIEFGMGPNVLLGGDDFFNTSLILAIGKTFEYGGVNIPINLAFSTCPMGQRLSFVFGYSIME